MKEADKNEIKLIIKEEISKSNEHNEFYTRDRIDHTLRILKISLTIVTVLITGFAYFGIPYLIKNSIDSKIGESALNTYREGLDSVLTFSKQKADSLNQIWIPAKNIYSQLDQISKASSNPGLINYLYVNTIFDEASTIKMENLSVNSWVVVPYRNNSESMAVTLTVKNIGEKFLILYSYRVKYSEEGRVKSAVLINQNGVRIKELYGDGGITTLPNTENQYSGAFIVKDLKPGKYELGLFDYAENSTTRVFPDPRQLVVYKLQ